MKVSESINNLIVNGYYIEDLESNVVVARGEYDLLTADQKKLVRNYSKLTQAESDLQKVKEVEALKDDESSWQKAFNNLSEKLEQLYEDRNK